MRRVTKTHFPQNYIVQYRHDMTWPKNTATIMRPHKREESVPYDVIRPHTTAIFPWRPAPYTTKAMCEHVCADMDERAWKQARAWA